MATEKDIRKFMKDNAPAMRDGGHFMENIVRQIDLLPVPASLDGSGKDIESEIMLVRRLSRLVKRRNSLMAVAMTLVVVIAGVFSVLLWLDFPIISETLSRYSYYIFGAVTVVVLSVSLVRIRAMKV
jgi:hypothetical protein